MGNSEYVVTMVNDINISQEKFAIFQENGQSNLDSRIIVTLEHLKDSYFSILF